jgi:hypothetical protein
VTTTKASRDFSAGRLDQCGSHPIHIAAFKAPGAREKRLDKQSAKVCVQKIVRASELLGECKPLIEQGSNGPDEAKQLKTNLGLVLADVFDRLLVPILGEHADLTPPQLKRHD